MSPEASCLQVLNIHWGLVTGWQSALVLLPGTLFSPLLPFPVHFGQRLWYPLVPHTTYQLPSRWDGCLFWIIGNISCKWCELRIRYQVRSPCVMSGRSPSCCSNPYEGKRALYRSQVADGFHLALPVPSGHLGSGCGKCYQSLVYPGPWAPRLVPIMGLDSWWQKKNCFPKVLLVSMSVGEQWKAWNLRIYLVGAICDIISQCGLNHSPEALLGESTRRDATHLWIGRLRKNNHFLIFKIQISCL